MNIKDIIRGQMSNNLCVRLRSLPSRADGTIIDSPEAQALFAEWEREKAARKAAAEKEAAEVAKREKKQA